MKVRFQIEYFTEWGESLYLSISGRKHPMIWGEGGLWSISLNVKKEDLLDYGYVVMRNGLIIRTEWDRHSAEQAENIIDHWIDCPIDGCPFPRRHQAAVFDKPGFRGAGTAIPIFALRTADDFGIGEFRDLRPLVDWAAKSGQCIIQLLPINDTTRKGEWTDSYPYSPVSAFALHPLYIRLQEIGVEVTPEFERIQKELNNRTEVDYPRVFKEKSALMLDAYRRLGNRDLKTSKFKAFVRKNRFWLDEYADFCARRDSVESNYYRWIQWHLDKQLGEEVDYARSKGVFLKGDLPIGVSAESADAFRHPELFNLDSCAGAPPDYFSRDGQNWGFPTYNWDEMAKDDFAWWKLRLRHMSRYFDAFRIDHILGFFRIWEIPAGIASGMYGHFNPAIPYEREEIQAMGLPVDGLFHDDPRNPGKLQPLISPDISSLDENQKQKFNGLYNDFFYHRHDEFWRRNAERKLPELLSATGMLACGEDLGMIPHCVPGVMDHERILSLKMRGMEHEGEWRTLSVCATSSHDMDTLRMQCSEDPDALDVLRMLRDFLNSPSMLAIFPFQDWLALDAEHRRPDRNEERINQPADPHHHWRFRLHIDLKELPELRDFTETVLALLKESGRA